jgi:PIN domain nuclease of toxin-antitoxin system
MQPLLWDTCTAIWIYEKARLSQAALEAMGAAYREGVPSYISPITAWEVGMLTAHGRLQLLIFRICSKCPACALRKCRPTC